MRVLIIDDQTLFTDRIEMLLKYYNPNISTTFSDNIFSAYQCIQDDTPLDLILININENSPCNSYDLIQRLYKLHALMPIVVISTVDSVEAATLAIENKVSGFISPKHSRDVILDSIIYVLEENMFSHKSVCIERSEAISSNQNNNNENKVITLQQQIIDLFYKGRMNNQIAEELNICSNTVNTYLHDFLRSLENNSRTEA